MKKLLLLCLLLTACAKEPLPALPSDNICDYAFNTWEAGKKKGKRGLFFQLGENEGIIFLSDFEVGLHELCHFHDVENDRASRSLPFKDAVDEFLTTEGDLQSKYSRWLEKGLRTNDIYADLCKISLIGELPTIFEQFFDYTD